MNIAIRGVGICTSRIRNVEDLCDQLLGENSLYKTGEENIIDTVQEAVREANAVEMPMIQVNSRDTLGISLCKAIKEAETMSEAAIICIQENEYGYDDAAVIAVSTNQEEGAWAVITGIDQGKGSPSSASKIYRTRGPVQEACGLIAECASLRYDMRLRPLEEEESYRIVLKEGPSEHRISIHGGRIVVGKAKAVDKDGIQITKHLVPLSFTTKEELLEKLSQLVQLVHRLSLKEISENVRKGFSENKERRRTVVLAAKDSEELLQEIESFLQVQADWETEGYVWKTALGSFYTSTPIKEGGKVCIVNPPANMFSKLKFFRLCRALPKIKKSMEDIFGDIEEKQPLIKWYAFESWTRRFAIEVFREIGVSYQQAVGMGLGELSLPLVLDYVALDDAFMESKESVQCAMQESVNLLEDLILSQPVLEERYLKKMPEGAIENWYVMCEKEKAERAVGQLKAKKLQVRKDLGYEIYSTSLQRKLEPENPFVAEAFVGSITRPVDISLIIRQIYEEGGRAFLSLGSGGACNQWIRESLQDKKDILVTSLFEEKDPSDSLPLLLAQCISYGIIMDYEQFYHLLSWKQENESDEELRAKLMEHLLYCNRQTHAHYKTGIHKEREMEKCQAAEVSTAYGTTSFAYLYGRQEILEITGGAMAKILGPCYQEMDQYEVHVRMPLPPFLFVSGITKIAAGYRQFEAGSYIEGEYKIEKDTLWLVNQSIVSNAVLIEAGHIGRFLMSYMGIDAAACGMTRYEVTEIIGEYYGEEWPEVGDTIELQYVIERFEKNKEGMRLYSSYEINYKGKPFMQYKVIGSFTNGEYRVSEHKGKEKERPEVMLNTRCPLYHPLTGRHQFTKNQVQRFLFGDISACFSCAPSSTPLMYWEGEESVLIDRVLDVSSEGGSFGYGYILAEKKLDESFWPFSVHFKNDPVLPGTVMIEMISQTIIFFATYMGLHNPKAIEVPRLTRNHPNRIRFYGAIGPGEHSIIVKVEPRKVEQVEEEKIIIYDGTAYCDGTVVLRHEGMALWIS